MDDKTSFPDFVEDCQVAAVVMDEGGRVVRATAAAAELLGFSAERLRGQRLDELAADGWQGSIQSALQRIAEGALDPFEALLRGRSGRRSLIRMIPSRGPTSVEHGHMLFWWRQSYSAQPRPLVSESSAWRLSYGLLRKHDDHNHRIASELGNNLASLVTAAKLTVECATGHLQNGNSEEATPLLASTAEQMREALALVRRLSSELMPSSLNDLGLQATIEWLRRRLLEEHPQLRVELRLDAEESVIGLRLRINLYRIIEEALRNAGRHSGASKASVTLTSVSSRLQLVVEDDGRGFDAGPLMRGDSDFKGLGLRSIASRVDATHGSLRVESMPGAGTAIEATWPIDAASLATS